MAKETYTTIEGEMLDAVVYTHYGYVDGAFEAVIDANPHVRELEEHLPAGVKITWPQLSTIAPTRMRRAWDKD